VTEEELQARVIALAWRTGLLVFHSGIPWHDIGRGFPDLVIIGPRGVLFAELKSAAGKLSAEQKEWRRGITGAGLQWRLWRPAHLNNGHVESELKEIASPPSAKRNRNE
jgi:hypothetical protein